MCEFSPSSVVTLLLVNEPNGDQSEFGVAPQVLKEKLPTVVGGDGVPRKGYKVAIKMVPTIFQGIMKLFVGEITERGW